MAKSKGSADRRSLNRIVKAINPENRKILQSGIIQRLGSPSPGIGSIDDFSVNTFAKNYRELDKASLNILFRDAPAQKQILDKMLKISEAYEKVARLANHSGTARGNLFYGLLGGAGIVTAPAATISSFMGS
ncbi:MAG: hypothetical protein AAF228_11790 [Pseudomonadota bacterium]